MDMIRMLRLWIIGWLGVCVPLLILLFGLGLDVSRSPAWQVVLFYLLLTLFAVVFALSVILYRVAWLRSWRGLLGGSAGSE